MTTVEQGEPREALAEESSISSSKIRTKKTTVTIESDESHALDSSYRPHLQARNIVIQRNQYGGAQSNRSSQSMERSSVSHSSGGMLAGGYQSLSNKGVHEVKTSRHKEKKDMQDLNERLASYIEKVRFLEAQNKGMADELAALKSKWGKETELIKAMYKAELEEARRLLDDAVKDRSRVEIRVTSMEEYLEDMKLRLEAALQNAAESRDRADRNNQQLSDYEGEIGLLRRRLEGLENDRGKEKDLLKRLQDALSAARSDLDNETLLHIDAENRRQTLEEELEFLKSVHEQELKELQAMAYRDTTSENREFWKNEMGQALREIQQAYDIKIDDVRGEMEGYYNLKVQEMRTGNARSTLDTTHSKEESKRIKTQLGSVRDKLSELENRNMHLQQELDAMRREKEEMERMYQEENMELKSEVAKLRAEMEAMLKELEHIIDTKLGLELEIAAYRKLLEGEESRVGFRHIVDSIISTSDDVSYTVRQTEATSGDISMKVSQVVKGEMSAKTTYQKSAKGPVAIPDCSADGKFIQLENTGRKEETLAGWMLKRNVDGVEKGEYTFPEGTVLNPSQKIKVWAKGLLPEGSDGNDIESDQERWAVGAHITTKLANPSGEDRATHIQKTNYT